MKKFVLLFLAAASTAHAAPVVVVARAPVVVARPAPVIARPAPAARQAPAPAPKAAPAKPQAIEHNAPVNPLLIMPHATTSTAAKCDPKKDKDCKK